MTKKVKATFIRTVRKMRDENLNVTVEDVTKDCEITSISYRTLILQSKRLPGGRSLHLLVGISHPTGVVLAEEYKINRPWLARFMQATLQKEGLNGLCSATGKEKLLLVMDNDPNQKRKIAKDALQEIGADLVEIPARSPDLNPIEHIFHTIKHSLREDALKYTIIREDFESFKQRFLSTLLQYDVSVIDRTMETMTLCLQRIAKSGG